MFRRPGFCLLSLVYRDIERAEQRWLRGHNAVGLPDVEPPFEAPLVLSRASCLELLGLVLLAGSSGIDLRVEYPDVLYATGAPPWKMATCVSEPLGTERVRACWANRHKKGGGEAGFDIVGRLRIKQIAGLPDVSDENRQRLIDMAHRYDDELNVDLHPGIARCELLVEGDSKERKRTKRSVSWGARGQSLVEDEVDLQGPRKRAHQSAVRCGCRGAREALALCASSYFSQAGRSMVASSCDCHCAQFDTLCDIS